MTDAPELPDLPDPEELKDRLSRTVAILTVVTTLAAALVGYLLASASRGDDRADVEAQRHAIRANGRFLRAQHRAQVHHQLFVLADEQRRRAAAAAQEELFASGQAARGFRLEQARWERVAERTQEQTSITEEGENGPQDDPAFPRRFFAEHRREPVHMAALQDAANQESAVWEGRVAQHTATLTLFAVALYLFGLSFTMQPRVRRIFAGVAASLLAAGLLWSLSGLATPPRQAPEEAADAFADAHVAFETAVEPADYREAVRLYSRALELRPDFARAYVERADATFHAGSPQRTGFASITRPANLRSATADLHRALSLGADTRSVRASLGFYTFVVSLQEDRPELLPQSVAFTRAALELDPRDPVLHFNLGVAHLAAGQLEEARAAYETGVRHVLFTDVGRETLRGNPSLEEQWVAGALTDLELVLAEGPRELGGQVRAMKQYVVGSVSRGTPGVGETEVSADLVEADVFPAEVQWRADLAGLDLERDVVSAQWYHGDPGGLGWSVIPEPSGIADARRDDDLGQHFELRSFLASTVPPRCLPEGSYRVELYVNGVLVGEGEGESAFGGLEAAVDRDVGVGFCHPRAWEPYAGALPGMLTGRVSADGSHGAYLMRMDLPSDFEELGPEARVELFLETFVDSFSSLFPEPPTFDRQDDSTFFMGLDAASNQEFVYPGGRVLVGAGLDEDGAVVIGAVYAPDEAHEDGLAGQVYTSLVRLG